MDPTEHKTWLGIIDLPSLLKPLVLALAGVNNNLDWAGVMSITLPLVL